MKRNTRSKCSDQQIQGITSMLQPGLAVLVASAIAARRVRPFTIERLHRTSLQSFTRALLHLQH